MFALPAKLVKNSDIKARYFFTFLENVQNQILNCFNSKFQSQ